jgi:lysyl-tRNA synthetase class 2
VNAGAPTASLATLRMRAEVLAQIREFFRRRGVLEVETPLLTRTGTTDPAIESVTVRVRSLSGAPLYLHSSPEHAMKRLLAAGSGDIFQICRVFRDAELGRWHQPEFTLLEWYRVGIDDTALMTEVEALLREVLTPRRALGTTRRVSYRAAFREVLDADPSAGAAGLGRALAARGIAVPAGLDRRGLLDLALSAAVAPAVSAERVTFIYDFPAEQAALARIKSGTPEVAARFEAFINGLELANGFAELTDAGEQRRRFEAEQTARRRANRDVPPIDETFLAALERGLPDCAGVALGVDRLIALAAGTETLGQAMSFAHAADERL